jgi:simple sugar transport system ATP-binding protein
MKYAVQMKNITKRFPRIVANQDINFNVEQGEIHGLVGENGAGKTTLMNQLYGLYIPSQGEIFINEEKVELESSIDAINLGIGMVHQHFMLIPRLTVYENIVLGAEPKKNLFFFDRAEALKRTKEICEKFDFQVDLTKKISEISLGMQQRVEIIKTLYRGAKVIILDEPTAVLTPQEIDELGIILRRLKSQGTTIIIITHKIEEIMSFTDSVTVLRKGQNAGELKTKETDEKEIVQMMVGRDIKLGDYDRESKNQDKTLLDVKDISIKEGNKQILKNISFQLKEGEILGLCGIDGSGQSEIAQAVCGLKEITQGSIFFEGNDISVYSIKERRNSGIAFIPQDRHKDGLILQFDVTKNLILGDQEMYIKNHQLDNKRIEENSQSKIDDFDIRCFSGSQITGTLSGGNQQKIIVARELSSNPKILVADQPTRGIDIGAIEFIHKVLIEKRNQNCGVLLISLELDELMQLSDRIAIINQGRIVAIVDPKKISRNEIGMYMVGEYEDN